MDTQGIHSASKTGKLTSGLILALWGFVTVLPFVWMFLTSFKTNIEISQMTQSFWP